MNSTIFPSSDYDSTTWTNFPFYNCSDCFGPTVVETEDEVLSMSLAEAITFAILMSACICATVIGNILVVLSVFTYRPLRGVQNFFIVSLAVADLAVAGLVMPFNVANFILGYWVFGSVFCDMWLTFDILTCTASILNLCAIALDRYYAIHDPINYAQKRTLKRVLITISIVWVASSIISVPPILGWNNKSGSLLDEKTGVCQLTDEKGFVIYSASGSFFIPLLIMTFVYCKIFIATRRRLRERAKAASAAKFAAATGKSLPSSKTTAQEASSTESPEDTQETLNSTPQPHRSRTKLLPSSDQNNTEPTTNTSAVQVHQFLEEKQKISLSRERRAARTLGIIMGVFVLCWLPFFLMYVWFSFTI
ncbi:unnamed protein product [Dimorphilus gyrociliatus]|uniref:G-protein coupled receptors family 1 profile domain-containing protein n=1 Tax=Dimorphilus gyrociliatus TaxID=2664684 RepID=A0A7I8VBN1_9ANNE|nr:unnamed protein product [Dimorphilus gyrociliatus]